VAKQLSEFLPEVVPQVPGCPVMVAKNAVRNAAITFCERTKAYRKELTAINLVASTKDYAYTAFTLPTDTLVWRPIRVAIIDGSDETKLEKVTPEDLDSDAQYANWRTETGTPFGYYAKDQNSTLRVIWTPDTSITGGLFMEAALKPSKAAAEVEDGFFNAYFDDIAAGALAALLSMAAEPWTNATKAADYLARFNRAIADHTVKIAEGEVDAPLRTVSYYSIG